MSYESSENAPITETPTFFSTRTIYTCPECDYEMTDRDHRKTGMHYYTKLGFKAVDMVCPKCNKLSVLI